MSSEDAQFLQGLLDQHDYELPQAGDIRKGIIVAKNNQESLLI
ncbi:MAG: hypothetical protein M5U34_46230 [Chloroflexi bacterium]|nr:hypothetical protein [Chloroflexota bacterium]